MRALAFNITAMADRNAPYDDPAHWHERDIICELCQCGFCFDMNEDTLSRVDRGEQGVWIATQCPDCLGDVPLRRLDD